MIAMAKMGMLKRGSRDTSQESTLAVFEVRCHRCDVTYPVGTKRCMYCGDRPGPQSVFGSPAQTSHGEDFGSLEDLMRQGEPEPTGAERGPRHGDGTGNDDEPEPPRGMLLRMLGSLSWVILLIAVSLYRSCTNG